MLAAFISSLKGMLRAPRWKTVADVFLWVVLLSFLAGGSAVIGARMRAQALQERTVRHWASREGEDLAAVIVMQPRDCAAMALTLDRVSSLLAMSDVPVRGLLSTSRSDDALADRLIAGDAVSFDLRKARSADLSLSFRAFGIDTTPIVVLTDTSGRVRYLAPLDSDQGAIDTEAGRILEIVSELRTVSK